VDVARAPWPCVNRQRDLFDDSRRGTVADRMHCIQAQSVEVVLLEPVQRVVDIEVAATRGVGSVKADSPHPGRLAPRIEELRAVRVEVVSFRAEVVVHDVEQHGEAERMRFVDQRLQVFRATIRGIGA
jgi:hypothetical protein